MEKISDKILSTKLIDKTDNYILQRSEIYINGKATSSIVVGAVLEASVKINEFYLVFMTDDIPNEDMLHIYLFDQNMHSLDSVTIGSPYATGSFSSLELVEPNAVKFNFIGSTKWTVRVFDKKQLHIPFLSDPKGVSRKMYFNCYLKVYGLPIPESV